MTLSPGDEPSPSRPVAYAPDHPRATTSLVLGILGLFCGLLAPFAWWVGRRTLDEIDAADGMVGGRSAAQVGYILGIVATVVWILVVLLLAALLIVFAVTMSTASF